MSGKTGKWLKMADFLLASDKSEREVRQMIDSGDLLSKTAVGEEYVWLEGEATGSNGGNGGRPESALDTAESVLEGESLVSRLSGAEKLAYQTERSISLVDRSLAAFMMMHKEVVEAKDRFVEQAREGKVEIETELREKDERIEELENELKEKEQEIADLKMLVEILEGQAARVKKTEEMHADTKASVGDLMEDQLKYIMEDNMVKELLKE